jgi:hypothetical protein
MTSWAADSFLWRAVLRGMLNVVEDKLERMGQGSVGQQEDGAVEQERGLCPSSSGNMAANVWRLADKKLFLKHYIWVFYNK